MLHEVLVRYVRTFVISLFQGFDNLEISHATYVYLRTTYFLYVYLVVDREREPKNSTTTSAARGGYNIYKY